MHLGVVRLRSSTKAMQHSEKLRNMKKIGIITAQAQLHLSGIVGELFWTGVIGYAF
jgi:hypothetical protein